MPPPSAGMAFHVCCSPENHGGLEAMRELDAALGLNLRLTSEMEHVREAERFLVYLSAETWLHPDCSSVFEAHVRHARHASTRAHALTCNFAPASSRRARATTLASPGSRAARGLLSRGLAVECRVWRTCPTEKTWLTCSTCSIWGSTPHIEQIGLNRAVHAF